MSYLLLAFRGPWGPREVAGRARTGASGLTNPGCCRYTTATTTLGAAA